MGGAPIRFAGGSANMGLVRAASGGRRAVDDGRNTHATVIEVVIEVVNEGKGRSFLASLGLSFNAWVVTLICSLLIEFVL